MRAAYSSRACASQPAVRATAKTASPGAGDHPRAAGQHGQGEVDVRLGQRPPVRLGQHRVGHGQPGRAGHGLAGPGPAAARPAGRRTGTRSGRSRAPARPRRSRSPTTRGAPAGSWAAASMASAPSEAPPCSAPPSAPSPVADHGVRVGPDRRGDPGGQGGRGQFVVGQQHQRGTQRAEQRGRAAGPGTAWARAGRRSCPPGRPSPSPAAGRQSTMPPMMACPAAITAGGSRCSRSGSAAASAGTMTWSRSSGSVPGGRARLRRAGRPDRLRGGPPRAVPRRPRSATRSTAARHTSSKARSWARSERVEAAEPQRSSVISVSPDSMTSPVSPGGAAAGRAGPAHRPRPRRTG